MVYRCILPDWAVSKYPGRKKVLEGEFSDAYLQKLNEQFYNCYFLPNYPTVYDKNVTVDGSHIDSFNFVFVDMDSKDRFWKTKDQFIEYIQTCGPTPTYVVDSGHGIHAYWQVTDLDAMSYLKLQRRLCRFYNTDEAVCKIYQLMRVPGTVNTKNEKAPIKCQYVLNFDSIYTCEELDKALPPITHEDDEYCQSHFNKTYKIGEEIKVNEKLPVKFAQLLRNSPEVKEIWSGNSDDRSKADYRLGHIMFASGFTKDEAMSVLVNSAKALPRAPAHRISYAQGIVDKIWTFEEAEDKAGVDLSPTVRDILSKGDDVALGERFPCHKLIDDTIHGFRLGQVIGVVGGSGVGKTTLTLNTFLWFAANNPDYHHFFFSLEQPSGEIASRIRTICQGNEALFDRIHIVSNYGKDGEYVHFSIESIEEHLLQFKEQSGHQIGACVVDHIGVLAKSDKQGESEGLMGICRRMKAVAVKVNMMLIMLSQAPREKAGIGDLELNKDSAFGTVFFESFVDYLICLWQPLKRLYSKGAPTIMAFKFAKIRHKKQGKDRIQEDTCYQLYFDPQTELLRELTQAEETAAKFYLPQAANARKLDRKTELVPYKSRRVGEKNGTILEQSK
jgi:KaiC/GvpD/RAD55 family RecA-like ATPase